MWSFFDNSDGKNHNPLMVCWFPLRWNPKPGRWGYSPVSRA